MPLPWKKPKSGRISRFVSDLQQSPKHGGSLVVETGFPTSLIDLFVKNRDRLKKSRSSKRNNNAPTQTAPTRPRVLSPPLPQKLDPPSVTEDLAASKIDESLVGGSDLTSENTHDSDNNNNDGVKGGDRGGECCVLMVVVVKVFLVAVLALSTKKLAVGITISAFTLLFIELAVARVFTLLKLCPDVEVRLHSLIGKLIRKKKKKKREEKVEESSSLVQERKNKNVSFEIIESFQDSRDCIEEVQASQEEREVETVLTKEKSKSAKLKSKIVKKLRSYKKKKKKLMMKEKQEAEGVKVELVQEDDETVTEVSSLYSEDRIESEISESSNPPWLESCEEVEEEEEGEESGSKGDLTKVTVLVLIALAGLLSGKVIAIVLTVSSCLILRFADKSQTSL